MGIEGFKFEPPPAQSEELGEQEREKIEFYQRSLEQGEGFDFSAYLGEGFDAEFFADKMATFPHDEMYEGWNEFLEEDEGGTYQDRQIEFGVLHKIVNKLTGQSDAPLMFPVFIQGMQDYCENRGIPADHITLERMERFYNHMTTSG